MKGKFITLIALVLVFSVVGGCFPDMITDSGHEKEMTEEEMQQKADEILEMAESDMTEEEMEEKAMEVEQEIMQKEEGACEDWKSYELKEVSTGEKFRICDFEGKPVLIESFAVWCPKCKQQQDTLKRLHDELGDSFISIALDTDPNEDENTVKAYKNRFGYTWRFAISPVELTKALIDEFGIGVVNAPSVPVILVCEDLSFRMLGGGQKSVADLKREIDKGC